MAGAGWLRRVGPWVGIGTSPVALMTGGGLAEGIEGPLLAVALSAGVVGLTALATVQGMLGQRRGQSLVDLTAGALGERGSRFTASPAMLAMMLGWLGINVGVAGTALGRLLGLPERIGMALFALVLLAVVWRGLDALSWSALAAGVATVTLAAYGLSAALDDRSASLLGDGQAAQPIGTTAGVALVIGYGAAFSLRTPDFTKDLERPRQVLWCALAGMGVPVAAFALVGAVLLLTTGDWNLADVLRDLGSPTVAYLFVAVGFTGSVMTNLYSGALSLEDVSGRVPHRAALVAVAVAGTALAFVGFADALLPYLTVMALAAPALIAVCCLHVARGERLRPGWHAAGLAAWGGGFALGLALHIAGSSLALPSALGAAALIYTICGRANSEDRAMATGERRS